MAPERLFIEADPEIFERDPIDLHPAHPREAFKRLCEICFKKSSGISASGGEFYSKNKRRLIVRVMAPDLCKACPLGELREKLGEPRSEP